MNEKTQKPSFIIDMYDSDGDVYEEGIWLVFGEGTAIIKVAVDFEDWKGFVEHINGMTSEIKENL